MRMSRPLSGPDGSSPAAHITSTSKPVHVNLAMHSQPQMTANPSQVPVSPQAAVPNPLLDRDTESMETHVIRTYNRRQSHSFNSSAYININTRSRAPSPSSSSGHADSVSQQCHRHLDGLSAKLRARTKTAQLRRDRSIHGNDGNAPGDWCTPGWRTAGPMLPSNDINSGRESSSGALEDRRNTTAASERKIGDSSEECNSCKHTVRIICRKRACHSRRGTLG